MLFASYGTYCYSLQTLTQIQGEKLVVFTKERQRIMKNIEISRLSLIDPPVDTPAGVVFKRFRATIRNYRETGATLELEIQLRDARQTNGNRIIVERLHIDQKDETSLGVTGEILRKIAVQDLAEKCVLAAIETFFPNSRPNKKSSLRVPSAADVSRTELVAYTSLSLGLNPSVKEIQEALAKDGVNLEEGTIRNYLTKAKKAGLMAVSGNTEYELPEMLQGLNPDTLSAEGYLIDKLLTDSAVSGQPPISPQEHRRRIENAKIIKRQSEARQAQILKLKHLEEITKQKSSKSIKTKGR